MPLPMTQKHKQQHQPLRWGFSTGASMCAVALAAWFEHGTRWQSEEAQDRPPVPSVPIEFLDGQMRHIPLFSERIQGMLAVKKDGGDDPDCTHGALFYGDLRKAALHEAHACDYIVSVGAAQLIVHALDGVGICTRLGLDCEQGKWAINTGPRHMLMKNLHMHGMRDGVWLFRFGVVDGRKRAQRSLNAHLGIEGGISILGTTGLVRPFSHEAHMATIELCVRAHKHVGGSRMVLCTGGRTQKGAKAYLPALPASAFTCIADFIAVSIRYACAYGMREIIIACMPGKLCKYAAGFENTHAHKVPQSMQTLCEAVYKHVPEDAAVHAALADCVTVRQALLAIPEHARRDVLHTLTEQALVQLAGFTSADTQLRIVLFDFQGDFMCEKSLLAHTCSLPVQHVAESLIHMNADMDATIHTHIGTAYFLRKEQDSCNP